MVFHVGCDAGSGEVCVFNSFDNTLSYFKVEPIITANVEEELNKIKLKIDGKLGCLCFYFAKKGQKLREKIIECGVSCGFEKVELIDVVVAMYFGICLHTNFKPKNGLIIEIMDKHTNSRWKKENGKAKLLGLWRRKEGNLFDGFEPHIVFWKNVPPDDLENLKAQYSHCVFLETEKAKSEEAAMIKARIMSNDPDYIPWDAANTLSFKTTATIGEKEIISFDVYDSLPITKTTTIEKQNFPGKQLFIRVAYTVVKKYDLPDFPKVNIIVSIDSNEIISVIFNEEEGLQEMSQSTNNLMANKMVSENSKMSEKNITESAMSSNNLLNKLTLKEKEALQKDFENNKQATDYILPKKITTASKIDAVGIDLGTSRCCAAVSRKNGIETVPLDNRGERLLPSFVAYDEKDIKCGQVVIDRLRHFSKSTIFDSKRIIGRNINEIEIDQFWPFKISNLNERILMGVTGVEGEIYVSAEEAATALLKFIKEKSERFQGKPLTKAVITVPANFADTQKNSTLKAAKLAGFENVMILPEPVAASFAYFVDREIPNNSNILLFDLGGGTLDVCIFRIVNYQIKIICNGGDTKIGGRDFDTVLINYFKNLLLTNYGISLTKNKKYKLMLECQTIKENLTTAATSCLDIEEFDANQEGLIYISREQFEKMTTLLLSRIKNTITAALYNSGLKTNQLNKVLQVGGGSRMPMIKNLLKELFPSAEHCCEEHPDEVVAIGAAYYAYHIFSSH